MDTVAGLKEFEPEITAAFRAASTESVHTKRINRSTEGEL